MPYKDRQKFLEYQRRYSKEVRSKRVPWYKRSPENYERYLSSLRKYRQKRSQPDYHSPTGWYYYKGKRLNFIKSIGGCQYCSYKQIEALILHHLDPIEDTKLNRYRSDTFTKAVRQGKTIVLCANCHMLVHKGIITCPSSSFSQLSLTTA